MLLVMRASERLSSVVCGTLLILSSAPVARVAAKVPKASAVAPYTVIDCTRRVGVPVEGFSLTARLSQRQITVGGPIVLTLALKNTSKKIRTIVETDPAKDYTLCVKDAHGISTFIRSKTPDLTWVTQILELRRGGTVSARYDLGRAFAFSKEGIYRITAGRKVPKATGNGAADIVSNVVVLEVTQPPAAEKR